MSRDYAYRGGMDCATEYESVRIWVVMGIRHYRRSVEYVVSGVGEGIEGQGV